MGGYCIIVSFVVPDVAIGSRSRSPKTWTSCPSHSHRESQFLRIWRTFFQCSTRAVWCRLKTTWAIFSRTRWTCLRTVFDLWHYCYYCYCCYCWAWRQTRTRIWRIFAEISLLATPGWSARATDWPEVNIVNRYCLKRTKIASMSDQCGTLGLKIIFFRFLWYLRSNDRQSFADCPPRPNKTSIVLRIYDSS